MVKTSDKIELTIRKKVSDDDVESTIDQVKKTEKDKSEVLENTKNNVKNLTILERILSFKGYFYAICMSFCLAINLIFIKMAPSLTGSEHSTIRYFFQLSIMGTVAKYKGLSFFGHEKAKLKWLIARGFIGATTIIIGLFAIGILKPSDVSALNNISIITTAIIARFVLGEKLSIIHFIAALLAITGVIFIIRPDYLFHKHNFQNVVNNSIANISISLNNSNVFTKNESQDSTRTVIGVILALKSAFLAGWTKVIVRKLCNYKIHFSLSCFYPAIVGLPLSICISLILFFANQSHKDLTTSKLEFIEHICYSFTGAMFSIGALVFMNLALDSEDASKVAILRSCDVLFSFILQYIILGVNADILSVMGAVFILSCTFLLAAFKIVEKKIDTNKFCLLKVLTYKF